MTVLKRKDFARWQAGEKLPDDALCNAVKEMENGLIDALGGQGKTGHLSTLQSRPFPVSGIEAE